MREVNDGNTHDVQHKTPCGNERTTVHQSSTDSTSAGEAQSLESSADGMHIDNNPPSMVLASVTNNGAKPMRGKVMCRWRLPRLY